MTASACEQTSWAGERMSGRGQNRTQTRALIHVRCWGKTGSRCVRAPMKKEAASAGVFDTPFGKFARLQILTIEDLFTGKKLVHRLRYSREGPASLRQERYSLFPNP